MPKTFFTRCALLAAAAVGVAAPTIVHAQPPRQQVANDAPIKRIAGLASVYYHNSHADMLISRLIETDTLDGKGRKPRLELVSLYVDQFPENDIGRELCKKYGVKLYDNPWDAVTMGTGKLAVDGVLLVSEHGKYPLSPTGAIAYPKRRLFEPIAKAVEESGRPIPVFIDKHLSDNWTDAKWIYDTATRLKMPLMAGSSLPVLWRLPPEDLAKEEPLEEVVALSFHLLDVYGFHAMEMAQCIAERRQGGESGVKSVQCLIDEEVWKAEDTGLYDKELLAAAVSRLSHPSYNGKDLRKRVKHPILFRILHNDGLRVNILTLDGAVGEFACAWRRKRDRGIQSTLFDTQEARPFMHFAYQMDGIERMMHSGKPSWPVERTLLTSSALDAGLLSKKENNRVVETPYLNIKYKSDWNWQVPPKRPPDRPLNGQ